MSPALQMWYDHDLQTLHPVPHNNIGLNSDAAWLRLVVRLNPFAEALAAAFWDRFTLAIAPLISGRENKNKDKRTKWFPLEGFSWPLFVASPNGIRKYFKRHGSVFAVSRLLEQLHCA